MERPENQSHLFSLDNQTESYWIVGGASTEASKWSAFPAEAAAMMTKESSQMPLSVAMGTVAC